MWQKWISGVASTKFWASKDFDFKWATAFCLGHRLLKHKTTRYSRSKSSRRFSIGFRAGLSTHFRPWTTMPFHITLWAPVDKQKIHQTQKSIYTLHSRWCKSQKSSDCINHVDLINRSLTQSVRWVNWEFMLSSIKVYGSNDIKFRLWNGIARLYKELVQTSIFHFQPQTAVSLNTQVKILIPGTVLELMVTSSQQWISI